MTVTFRKTYPDQAACRQAAANHRWLTGLLRLPRLYVVHEQD